jgi:predicted RNA-binding protein YlqC (UPF0109 family)
MDTTKKDEALLRAIIDGFTKHADTLIIESEERGERATMMNLWAHRSDHPKIIGSQGKHIQALRTIFLYIAKRERRDISIMINEPKHGEREEMPPYMDDPTWEPDESIALMRSILDRVLLRPYKVVPHENDEQTILYVTPNEAEQRIADGMKPYLHTIFHAIGKQQGRKLYVDTQRAIPDMPEMETV